MKTHLRWNRVPRSLLAKLGLTGKPGNRDAVARAFRHRKNRKVVMNRE